MVKFCGKSNTCRFDMCKRYHKEGVNLTVGEWLNFVVSRKQVDSTCVRNLTRKGVNLTDDELPHFVVSRIQVDSICVRNITGKGFNLTDDEWPIFVVVQYRWMRHGYGISQGRLII